MLSSLLPGEQYYMVDIAVTGNKEKTIKVLVDSDEGIDIDTCALISRNLSERLEEEDLIEDSFVLEVSSPGIDYPLKSLRQYRKNIGRRIQILLKDNKIIEGELMMVDEEQIKVKQELKQRGKKKELKEMVLPFDQIKKSKILVSFKK